MVFLFKHQLCLTLSNQHYLIDLLNIYIYFFIYG